MTLALLAAGALASLLPQQAAHADDAQGVLRIGYQKGGSLLVLEKSQGNLEKKLAPLGFAVKWVEFPAGPQLLEGLNVGSVDIGFVGEAPPVFAQAAGAKFYYVGFDPSAPAAEAVVVPKDSPIRTVAQLKGKKVALNRGSNVHYLLVRLLEKNGVKPTDITPIYLPPADARAAFESRAVDAWVIWDPYLAVAQHESGARVVADGTGVVDNFQFYLGARGFVDRNPRVIHAVFDELVERGTWLKTHIPEAARQIAPLQGLPADVVEASLRRYAFHVRPLDDATVASQQRVADTFFELKLIPKPVAVREATWKAAQ